MQAISRSEYVRKSKWQEVGFGFMESAGDKGFFDIKYNAVVKQIILHVM